MAQPNPRFQHRLLPLRPLEARRFVDLAQALPCLGLGIAASLRSADPLWLPILFALAQAVRSSVAEERGIGAGYDRWMALLDGAALALLLALAGAPASFAVLLVLPVAVRACLLSPAAVVLAALGATAGLLAWPLVDSATLYGALVLPGLLVWGTAIAVALGIGRVLVDPASGAMSRLGFAGRIERGSGAVLAIEVSALHSTAQAFGAPVAAQMQAALLAMIEADAGAVGPGRAWARSGRTVGVLATGRLALWLEGAREHRAQAVAERLQARLARPLDLLGVGVVVDPRIGVALHEAGEEGERSILAAEAALRRTRRGAPVARWTDDCAREAQRRLVLERELRAAMDDAALGLCLHYQPIVATDDGEVRALEALLRWRHPGRGMLLPRQFLPVAEASGLIVALGAWAVARAAQDQAMLREAGLPDFVPVFVNLCGAQLDRPAALELAVERALAEGAHLGLELSEGAVLADAEAGASLLRRLGARGVTVAIDDFGVSRTGFAALHDLPARWLKVDGSVVEAATTAQGRDALAAIVALARTQRFELVAEQVETEAERAVLVELGVRFAQGRLFGRPVSPEALALASPWLGEGASATAAPDSPDEPPRSRSRAGRVDDAAMELRAEPQDEPTDEPTLGAGPAAPADPMEGLPGFAPLPPAVEGAEAPRPELRGAGGDALARAASPRFRDLG